MCEDAPVVLLEEEGVIEEDGVNLDEGYQSTLDCTKCKNNLAKIEESYKQQIAALELELINKQNRIDKYYFIKNELANDEENFYEGKGKGGKGYMRKGYDSKQHALKEQYLRKIRNDEKRHFRFLQLDYKTQLMISRIDALRGSVNDDQFIDKLLETFEEKCMLLQSLKGTVENMKQVEGEYVKTIDELMHQHHESIKEKDHEIDYLRKNVQIVLVEKEGSGELSKRRNEKKSKKHLQTDDLDDEYQITIANMQALRQLDNGVYSNVVQMLGWEK